MIFIDLGVVLLNEHFLALGHLSCVVKVSIYHLWPLSGQVVSEWFFFVLFCLVFILLYMTSNFNK